MATQGKSFWTCQAKLDTSVLLLRIMEHVGRLEKGSNGGKAGLVQVMVRCCTSVIERKIEL